MIYMCACLLLDPFQLYIEMPVVFGLSIYTATATAELLGMKMCCWDFFGRWGDCNKVVLLVIAEKMKICTYLHVRYNPYPQDVS